MKVRSEFATDRVDRAAGILRGVTVLQTGPVGRYGHVDETTLVQFADLANAEGDGLKVRWGHPSPLGTEPLGTSLGWARNFAMAGDKLRCDVHFLDVASKAPLGDLSGWIMGIALESPRSIGLSVVFEPAEPDRSDDSGSVRVAAVEAVDFVESGVATPGGLFGRFHPGAGRLASLRASGHDDAGIAAALDAEIQALRAEAGAMAEYAAEPDWVRSAVSPAEYADS